MTNVFEDHTFAILCYKQSPFLVQCIQSITNQTVTSNIILTTSTPSDFLEKTAQQFGLPIIVNKNNPGIATDWNFGLQSATTQYVTLAHQDDIYEPNYLAEFYQKRHLLNQSIIGFSDYFEIKDNSRVKNSLLLWVKRVLLLPMILLRFSKNKFVKKLILRFGDPICCPSIIFNKNKIDANPFDSNFKMNLDWYFLWKASNTDEGFLMIPKKTMGHRIHSNSTTTEMGEKNIRILEDAYMFEQTLGKFISTKIVGFYKWSYKLNQ